MHPTAMLERRPVDDGAILDALDAACGRIAPVWPLERFVAVNPYVGLADHTFEEAAKLLTRIADARTTMPLGFYLEAFDRGQISEHALAATLAAGASPDHEAVEAFVQRCRTLATEAADHDADPGLGPVPSGSTPTVAQIASLRTGSDWTQLVTERVSSWSASYFDVGQASWRPDDADHDAFQAWRSEASIDRTPEVMGLRGFRAAVRALPEDPAVVASLAAERLGLDADAFEVYVHSLLLSVGGWAAHSAWIGFEAALRSEEDESLRRFAATLLSWELALLEVLGPRGIEEDWTVARSGADWSGDRSGHALEAELVLQAAFDRSEQERLIATFAERGPRSAPDRGRPAAQAVFCIDVRSEVFRRHLEAAQPDIATIGFAGFFGAAIEYVPIGHEHGSAQCPVLLTPTHTVFESLAPPASSDVAAGASSPGATSSGAGSPGAGSPGADSSGAGSSSAGSSSAGSSGTGSSGTGSSGGRSLGTASGGTGSRQAASATQAAAVHRRLSHHVRRAWKSFKMGAISCFSFVGPVGLIYLPKLFTDSSGRTRPTPDPESEGLRAADGQRRVPSLDGPAAIASLDLPARVAMAEGFLRGTSLQADVAPLVLIVGHGSTTVNNPYESGLNCGACGGNTGEANARIAALILNDPAVRDELAERGLAVPADTWFVAGLHDTTTDRVTTFDVGALPAHLHDALAEVEASFAAAGKATRRERSARLGLPEGADVDAAILRRSNDWAQVRPEWALAGCRSFIAAPREHTRDIDLQGQAFLHSYDWRLDDGFNVLELILTAPVVVASWINLQYFASTVEPHRFGSGNKTLHNVVGRIGVLEGNGGDLRVGLPWQSVHDGDQLQHQPLKLSVVIAAPTEAMDSILAKHQHVADLCDNGWIHLLAMDDAGQISARYLGHGSWTPT